MWEQEEVDTYLARQFREYWALQRSGIPVPEWPGGRVQAGYVMDKRWNDKQRKG